MPIIRMRLSVSQLILRLSVVREVNVDGHLVDTLYLLNAVWLCRCLIPSEVGRFVHVEPDT